MAKEEKIKQYHINQTKETAQFLAKAQNQHHELNEYRKKYKLNEYSVRQANRTEDFLEKTKTKNSIINPETMKPYIEFAELYNYGSDNKHHHIMEKNFIEGTTNITENKKTTLKTRVNKNIMQNHLKTLFKQEEYKKAHNNTPMQKTPEEIREIQTANAMCDFAVSTGSNSEKNIKKQMERLNIPRIAPATLFTQQSTCKSWSQYAVNSVINIPRQPSRNNQHYPPPSTLQTNLPKRIIVPSKSYDVSGYVRAKAAKDTLIARKKQGE